jgi:Secretion system C-terminal sorting domain
MERCVKYLFLILFLPFNGNGQTLTFPDPNFENALVNFEVVDTTGNGLGDSVCDTNGDGFIQLSEAEAVTGLIVSYFDIESLEGIGYFSNLETLKSRGNFLTTLDLSQNTQLSWLHVETNPMTDLDISQNFLMERLWIYQLELTSLDVSHMPNLESLRVYTNYLEELNIQNGNNVLMANFEAYNNPNLHCIQVDDEAFANAQPDWLKDESAVYSENCVLGVSKWGINDDLVLYPNPVKDQLMIAADIPIMAVMMFDRAGKKLRPIWLNETTLDVEKLQRGLYFVQFSTSTGMITKGFVKD